MSVLHVHRKYGVYMSGIATDCPRMSYVPYLTTGSIAKLTFTAFVSKESGITETLFSRYTRSHNVNTFSVVTAVTPILTLI